VSGEYARVSGASEREFFFCSCFFSLHVPFFFPCLFAFSYLPDEFVSLSHTAQNPQVTPACTDGYHWLAASGAATAVNVSYAQR
jgi:hypothetical protein